MNTVVSTVGMRDFAYVATAVFGHTPPQLMFYAMHPPGSIIDEQDLVDADKWDRPTAFGTSLTIPLPAAPPVSRNRVRYDLTQATW